MLKILDHHPEVTRDALFLPHLRGLFLFALDLSSSHSFVVVVAVAEFLNRTSDAYVQGPTGPPKVSRV